MPRHIVWCMSYRSKPDKHKAAVFVFVILYSWTGQPLIINLYTYAIYYCFRCVQTITVQSDLALLRFLSSECVSQTPLFQRSNGKSTKSRRTVVVVIIADFIIIDNNRLPESSSLPQQIYYGQQQRTKQQLHVWNRAKTRQGWTVFSQKRIMDNFQFLAIKKLEQNYHYVNTLFRKQLNMYVLNCFSIIINST